MSKKYVLVTTISHHRIRYCIPVDELDNIESDTDIRETSMDLALSGEVREFSQGHISEDVIDTKIVSEQEVIDQFRQDNDYLSEWSDKQVISWVYNNI